MRKILQFAAASFVAFIIFVFATVLVHRFAPGQPVGQIRYIDLISVVLTALSIMITVLGLFVAALGVIGWATFENKLRDTSLEYFTAELSKDGKLRKEFEELLTQISLSGIETIKQSPDDQPVNEEGEEKPYND